MTEQIKRSPGRPSLGDAAKRHPLSFRTTTKLRSRMLVACEESGRSLAQEIEYRLEQSFHNDLTLLLECLVTDLDRLLSRQFRVRSTDIDVPEMTEIMRDINRTVFAKRSEAS